MCSLVRWLDVSYNYLTEFPAELTYLTDLVTAGTISSGNGNFMVCAEQPPQLPENYCQQKDSRECVMEDCENDVPICHLLETGNCRVKCGPKHYHFDGFCYLCSNITEDSPCQSCDGEGNCVLCHDDLQFVGGECIKKCDPGFYLNGVTCMPCKDDNNPTHCVLCTSLTQCTQCDAGYTITQGLCTECGGNYYSDSGTECILGQDNCAISNHTKNECVTCELGYKLTDFKTCDPCPSGTYGRDGTTCTQIDNCVESLTALHEPDCKKCDPEYGINSTGGCSLCPENHYSLGETCEQLPHCEDVLRTAPECKRCEKGYYISDVNKSCMECPERTYGENGATCERINNCRESPTASKEPQCTKCEQGYEITDKNECAQCKDNEYSDLGTVCTPVENCVNASKTTQECNVCSGGFFITSDLLCSPCSDGKYGINGITCETVEHCIDGDPGKTVPSCTQCEPKYEPKDGVCHSCEGNTYSFDGSKCEDGPDSCVLSDHAKKWCIKCQAGYYPDTNDGSCLPCSNGKYGKDGLSCIQVDKCVAGDAGKTVPSCTQCEKGYEPSNGECAACEGNTYSNNGQKCRNGVTNCEIANHTWLACVKCAIGHKIDENGACVECPTQTYGTDGVGCLASTPVENCVEYHKTQDRCAQCGSGLLVSTDNICRTCTDGEIAVGNECYTCESGTYSIYGETNCTSDCDAFSGKQNACLHSGFCKVSMGSCVQTDDNTAVIVVAAAGGGGGLIVIIIVILIVLARCGWFAARKSAKEEAAASELETMAFVRDIDVDVRPHTLMFGGQAVGPSVELCDTIFLTNNEASTIRYRVSVEGTTNGLQLLSDTTSGTVKSGESAEIVVRGTKSSSKEGHGCVRVSVMSAKEKDAGQHININVVMAGLGVFELSMLELEMQSVIGEGSFGIVYRGVYDGKSVAIKKLKNPNKNDIDMFTREVELLKLVRGRNVVVFYGAVTADKENLCHVTELMDIGTLSDVLNRQQLSPQMKVKVMRDIAVGMMTVHSFDVIHRDLKPDNVLCRSPFTEQNDEACKITDFGTSRAVEAEFDMTMTKGQGTPLYMAPEIICGQKRYTHAVDVYSYGITAVAVWNNGRKPFSEFNFQSAMLLQNAILEGCRPQFDAGCPFADLAQHCWAEDPEARPSFRAICEQYFSF